MKTPNQGLGILDVKSSCLFAHVRSTWFFTPTSSKQS